MGPRVLTCAVAVALTLSVQPLAQASVPSDDIGQSAISAKQPVKGPREAGKRTAKPLKARLAVSPRDGAKVTTHPVRISVRTGKRTTVEQAQLNGRTILKELHLRAPGVFRTTVSSSHGLRHGRNTLRVRVLAANGKMRTATSHFRVAHSRPLAGAGRDRTMAAGSTLQLSGTAVPHPSLKGVRIKRTWTLLQAPQGSRIGEISKGGARLRTDIPGTYRVRLTTTQGGKQTTDVMEGNAVEAPLVTIDTMDSREGDWGRRKPGITVAGTFYPSPQANSSSSGFDGVLQLLILNRKTLQLVRNVEFQSDFSMIEYDESGKWQEVGPNDLDQYDSDTLWIASVHPGAEETTADRLFRTLGHIGAPAPGQGLLRGGDFSLIGVPGMQRGEATYNHSPGASGRIQGYLTLNRWDFFQYLDPRSSTFTTRIGRGCGSTGCGTTFAVDGTQYASEFSNALAGYTVDVFEGHTLRRKDHDAFGTNGPNATAEASRMIDFLQTHAGSGDLVVINSASNGDQLLIGPQAKGDVAKRLAAAVAAVGGTLHRFNTAAITAGQQYTLMGWVGASEGDGEEAIGQNPVIQGRLNPDNALLFKPAASSEEIAPNDTVQKVLLQAPGTKSWPELDNPAIAWIGNHTTPKLGPNPRSAYWTQAYNWASVSQSIDDLTWDCPKGVDEPKRCVDVPGGKDPGFTQEQFNRARDVLSTEASWVSNVRNYMGNFAAPYEKAATNEWEDTQTQAYTKFRAKPDPLAVNPLDVLFTILDLFEPFAEEVEKYGKDLVKLLAVAATAFDFGAMHLDAQKDGSSPDEELQVEADHLATKLRDQAQNTAASFDVMGDLIVSDYAKLSAIGPLAECNGADGDEQSCPAEYQWDKDAIKATAAAVQRSAQRQIYAELIPVQFPVWTIKRSHYDDSTMFYCDGLIQPFRKVQKQARIAALAEIYPDGSQPKQYDTYTIADVYSRYSVTNLDDKVLKQLFTPAPASLQVDRDNDGLGFEPQEYARESRSDDWPDHAWNCSWG